MSLHPEDTRVLEGWWGHCWLRPGELPAPLKVVQQKIVRAVGHGELPHRGSVYVKAMWFPRLKDRLRYVFRTLPGRREAQMLGVVRRAGIPCPEVVFVRGRRVLGAPRLSLLVVADLHPQERAPEPRAMIQVASRLLQAGVFHPDLNPNNFLLLPGGETAVLDLHSARRRSTPIPKRERMQMVSKLLSHMEPVDPHLQDAIDCGLLHGDEVSTLLQDIREIRRRWLVSRIHRCFKESTLFKVGWRWNGTLFRRRGAASGGTWVEGGPELVRYWIGDRSQEVLAHRAPVLGGLFRRSALLPGKHKLYIPGGGQEVLQDALPQLLEGHAKYLELLRGVPRSGGDSG